MPFRETNPMEERVTLLREFDTGAFSVTALCERHGISRGYPFGRGAVLFLLRWRFARKRGGLPH